MPAGQTNFLIEKGADFVLPFLIRDKTTKLPTNLTNCAITFKVAAKQGGPEVFEIPVIIDGTPSTGKFTAEYSIANVELITLKEGWATINIIWSDGLTERLVEGRIVISKGVQ